MTPVEKDYSYPSGHLILNVWLLIEGKSVTSCLVDICDYVVIEENEKKIIEETRTAMSNRKTVNLQIIYEQYFLLTK